VNFEEYMYAVDRALRRLAGLSHRDITDGAWQAAFDAGRSPHDAAQSAVAAMGR